jgi:serine/threonine-protein kinase
MATKQRYCRACNESFAVADNEGRCPQCGLAMTGYDLTPTIDLEETALLTAPTVTDDRARLVELLIGRPFDNYTIDAFLGQGGMASVFRAVHNSLYRPCAIKILAPSQRNRDSDLVELFLAEARAAASVVHPHIVTVHNIGQAESLPFIEMEYVAGQTLQSMVQAAERLEPYQATELLAQACSALGEAHRCGLVHRDFKPSNILVSQTGLAKLADFGLAKRVQKAGGVTELLAGTPYYMAPELFRGESATRRSDVYAVGVSYYYMLTGQFPFAARGVLELAEKHAADPIPDPREHCPDLPAAAVELLQACLAKDPQCRPAEGLALHAALQDVLRALRSLPSLIAAALDGVDVAWEVQGRCATVTVPQPNGRWQRVFVQDGTSEVAAEQVIKIFSVCCAAQETYYRRALELNATVSHGSLAIQEIDGQSCFVMVNSYPRATCDPEEVRHSVLDIAQWADQVEHALTGQDQY